MRSPAEIRLTIVVSVEQLALLKKLDFPCSQGVLASARPSDEGTELTRSWLEFDMAPRVKSAWSLTIWRALEDLNLWPSDP